MWRVGVGVGGSEDVVGAAQDNVRRQCRVEVEPAAAHNGEGMRCASGRGRAGRRHAKVEQGAAAAIREDEGEWEGKRAGWLGG